MIFKAKRARAVCSCPFIFFMSVLRKEIFMKNEVRFSAVVPYVLSMIAFLLIVNVMFKDYFGISFFDAVYATIVGMLRLIA